MPSNVGKVAETSKGLAQLVEGWKHQLKTTTDLEDKDGISLLSLKSHFLVDYIHNLALLTLLKFSNRSIEEDSGCKSLVENLVSLRVAIEKIRPLEKRLTYQIDKVLKKAQEAEQRKESKKDGKKKQDNEDDEDIENVINDPLSFKPNLSNLASNRDEESSSSEEEGEEEDKEEDSDGDLDSDEEKEGKGKSSTSKKSKVYRPPKIAPVAYPEPGTEGGGGSKRKQRYDRRADQLIAEMAGDIAGNATPYAETTTGLANTVSAASKKQNRRLEEMNRFEEENMTRMFMNKKAARQRRQDEEDAVFGSRRDPSTLSKRGRRAGGFDAEIGDLIGAIGRTTGENDDNSGSSRRKDAYEDIRGLKRKAPRFEAGGEESSSSGAAAQTGRRKGDFEKVLSKASKKKAKRS